MDIEGIADQIGITRTLVLLKLVNPKREVDIDCGQTRYHSRKIESARPLSYNSGIMLYTQPIRKGENSKEIPLSTITFIRDSLTLATLYRGGIT